jgi:hypothetical protein
LVFAPTRPRPAYVPSPTPLWLVSGLDLNAFVAQNRTWIQCLMESAPDNHTSSLLEGSLIQVIQYVARTACFLFMMVLFINHSTHSPDRPVLDASRLGGKFTIHSDLLFYIGIRYIFVFISGGRSDNKFR